MFFSRNKNEATPVAPSRLLLSVPHHQSSLPVMFISRFPLFSVASPFQRILIVTSHFIGTVGRVHISRRRMGVLGLSKLIADEVPSAVKETELKSYFGRRVAVDASMSLYQFLIAIRFQTQQLTNDAGETTSHITGFFYRTVKMLENGIKPVFVFDGKPPEMKLEILRGRRARANAATDTLNKMDKDEEEIDPDAAPLTAKEREAEEVKLSKRTVRMTAKHVEDVKTLLKLLGVPTIDAPSEAESQCAQLCKEGLVYGVATEDVDVLAFGCAKMIRHMTNAAQERIKEIDLQTALTGLELTHEQLIDLSILLGCDYCPGIRGIGPKTGLKLIRSLESIENILKEEYGVSENCDTKNGKGDDADVEFIATEDEGSSSDEEKKELLTKKEKRSLEKEQKSGKKKKKEPRDKRGDIPENWRYKEARKLFVEPDVKRGAFAENDLKIRDPDEEGLIEFLCKQNQFDEERVRSAIKRIQASKGKASQTRIDSFFQRAPSTSQPSSAKKPKVEDKKNGKSNGAKASSKGGGRGRRPK